MNGSLQVTNELNLGGDAETQGTAGSAGQVLTSNGPDKAPSWQTLAIPEIPSSTVGSVIALDGQLVIAQEITVQMSGDYTKAVNGALQICNLDVVIVDNENMYTGTATGNTFKVSSDGVYQIMMNMQIEGVKGAYPVIGIWEEEVDKWMARIHEQLVSGKLQTFTLITAVELKASKTYSFRIAGADDKFTVKSHSSGTTGSGPVSQVTVRRLK